MDILAFLKDRTTFIRSFYSAASGPFTETKRKIESGEAPFEWHLAKHEDEPPFTTEWNEADDCLEVLGRVCVSMLSAALKLYFNTWCRELGIELQKPEKSARKKHGTIAGFKQIFSERLKIDWAECPVNFAVLEQVFLARNRDQHPDRITTQSVNHHRSDLKKYSEPFFLSDADRKILADPELAEISFWSFRVHVNGEKLFAAADEVESLCEWLEPRLIEIRWPR